MQKYIINFEEFKNLYDKRYSDRKIAEILKCGEETIRKFRVKNNISRHKSFTFNFEEAEKLFNQGLKYSEIAKILNVKEITLSGSFLRHNGKLNWKTNSNKSIFLTQEQKEIMFGSMLGDGCLRIEKNRKNKSPRGTIMHSMKQEEYVKYKHFLLKEISLDIKNTIRKPDKRTGNIYESCSFQFKSNPALYKLYSMFYTPIKKIPKNLDLLTPLAISIWFMDDGMKMKTTIGFATNCFSIEDLTRLIEYLKITFNLEFTIKKSKTIYLKQKSYNIFYNLINEYIIPSMKYKLPEAKNMT